MQSRPLVWIGMFIGSTVGGFIPMLWGAGMFDISGILFSGLGAIVGIYIGFKMG